MTSVQLKAMLPSSSNSQNTVFAIEPNPQQSHVHHHDSGDFDWRVDRQGQLPNLHHLNAGSAVFQKGDEVVERTEHMIKEKHE